jgi:predicted transcriptional regulator
MTHRKLTKLELQIMDALWMRGSCSVREIQEAFPEPRPAYTTIQTTVYRLESMGAVRIAKRVGNANVFEAVLSRGDAQSRVLDEVLSLFGGKTQPMMAHLIQTGKLSLEDVKEAEQLLRALAKDKKEKTQ